MAKISTLTIKIGKLKLRISLNFAKFVCKHFCFILMILDYILPKNNKKIIFNSIPDYGDNAQVLYEHIEKNNVDEKYDLHWILNESTTEPKSKNSHYLYSFKAIFHILTAKYAVVTHTSNMIDLLYSKRRKIINLWHGMPFKTIGYLEPNLQKKIFNRYKKLGKQSYLFATSDIFKQFLIPCFKADFKNIFITGQPRTDIIWNDKNNDKLESIFQYSKFNKVILYMPTYKELEVNNLKQKETEFSNIFYMNDYDEKSFVEYIEKNNILFIMKPHPFEEKFYQERLETLPKSDNFKIVYNSDFADNDLNTYELFKFIDLMISDFSSVAIDYMILNKPVIYLNNLSDEYNKNRGMVLEDNIDFLMVGTKANSFNQLLEGISNDLEKDLSKDEREKILPLLHKYLDNKACERIFKIMRTL